MSSSNLTVVGPGASSLLAADRGGRWDAGRSSAGPVALDPGMGRGGVRLASAIATPAAATTAPG